MTQLSDPVTHTAEPTGDRPRYPLSRAAQMAGVSLSTIKRARADGKFSGAVKDSSGAWTVGVEDLLAAGFHLNRPQTSDPAQPDASQLSELAEKDRRIEQLERQLFEERVMREAADLVAADREKRAQTAERALLMLESGPAKQRWWQRKSA